MKTAFILSGQTKFYEAGNLNNPALIFLHNGGSDNRIWSEQLRFFSRDYHVICVDLPGFGGSESNVANGEELSLAYYVEWLDAFIRYLALDKLSLVGNCMGSAIALRYSQQWPDKVEALALFNFLTLNTFQAGLAGRLVMMQESKLGRMTLEYFARMTRVPYWLGKQLISLQTFGGFESLQSELAVHLISLYQKQGQLTSLHGVLADLPEHYASFDNLQNLPSTNTIMVWGEHNRILPISAGFWLATNLNPAEWHCIPNSGHLCMAEQPEKVNQILGNFLKVECQLDKVGGFEK